jgi:hypothetical protein
MGDQTSQTEYRRGESIESNRFPLGLNPRQARLFLHLPSYSVIINTC